jgi:uncharacterized Zn-finger protein
MLSFKKMMIFNNLFVMLYYSAHASHLPSASSKSLETTEYQTPNEEEEFWDNLLQNSATFDERPIQSTSSYAILDDDFDDTMNDPYNSLLSTHSDTLPVSIIPESPKLSPTIFSLPKQNQKCEIVEDPHKKTTLSQYHDYNPPTPSTSLTNAISDLNFLSPSVFTENQNPFALAFSRTQSPSLPSQESTQKTPQTNIQSRQNVIRRTSSNRLNTRGRYMSTQSSIDRPYQCPECHRSFSRLEHRKRHFKMHTGERPFQCETCGKSFSRPDNFSQHLRTHEVQSK